MELNHGGVKTMSAVEFRSLLHTIRQLSLRLEACLNRAAALHGLTAAQAQVLAYVLEHCDGVCATEMYRATGLSKPSISALVKKLKGKGYVYTKNAENDDRQKLIFATPQGEALGHSIQRTLKQLQAKICNGLDLEELRALQALQHKMLLNVS